DGARERHASQRKTYRAHVAGRYRLVPLVRRAAIGTYARTLTLGFVVLGHRLESEVAAHHDARDTDARHRERDAALQTETVPGRAAFDAGRRFRGAAGFELAEGRGDRPALLPFAGHHFELDRVKSARLEAEAVRSRIDGDRRAVELLDQSCAVHRDAHLAEIGARRVSRVKHQARNRSVELFGSAQALLLHFDRATVRPASLELLA